MTKFFTCFFLLGVIILNAETVIPGGAVSGIWNLESSPYLIEADVLVELDTQLTIEPGVQVTFSSGVQMEVFGSLQAEGAAADSIYFQPENIIAGWTGIRVYGTEGSPQDSTLFRYCSFKYARSLDGYLTSRGGALLICEVDNAIVDYCDFTHNIANYGGALHVRSCSPIIQNSYIRYNEGTHDAGGIFLSVGAAPLIQNCLIEYNKCNYDGGGIFMVDNCSPTLVGLTIRNNKTQDSLDGSGGGIAVWNSTPFITNCVITQNYSSASGGGIEVISDSNPTIVNCIISKNMAKSSGGGIIFYDCEAELAGCTISYNTVGENGGTGGGICIFEDSNVIFSESNKSSIYLNNNLSYVDTGNDIYLSNNNISVMLDTFTVANPTDYFILPAENLNLDIEHGLIEPTDQDIFVSPEGLISNSGLSLDDPINSVYVAVLMVESSEDNPLTIHLADGVYSPEITNEIFPLELKSYLILEGNDNTILDAEHMGCVVIIHDEVDVTLKNIRITGGSRSGIRLRDSSVSLENLDVFENENSDWSAGGIGSTSSELEISNCTIRENSSTHKGGGIYLYNSALNLHDTSIISNFSSSGGGGIYLHSSDLNLHSSSIRNNSSVAGGGGMYIQYNSTVLFDSLNVNSIYNNIASSNNGGNDLWYSQDDAEPIAVIVDTFTVLNPQDFQAHPIQDFIFEIAHGFIPQIAADLYVNPNGDNNNDGLNADSPFRSISYALNAIYATPENPRMVYVDEGIYSSSQTNEVLPLVIRDNITVMGIAPELTIIDCESESRAVDIIGNQAKLKNFTIKNSNSNYGGIYLDDAVAELNNLIVKSCHSTFRGGGVSISESTVDLLNIKIQNCSTENYGGGIYADESELYLTGVSITNNSSQGSGAGIYTDETSLDFDETNLCSIYDNSILSNGYWGRDLTIYNLPANISVHLDTFTVAYPNSYFAHISSNFSITVNYFTFDQYDADLYVSENGNDNNSGISESAPKKSISNAVLSIIPNEVEPRTIYISSGTYSQESTGELFPFSLLGPVILQGENRNTIIDGDIQTGIFNKSGGLVEFNSITFMNSYGAPVITGSNDIFIKNCLFKNCRGYVDGIIKSTWGGELRIENTVFQNNSTIRDNRSMIYVNSDVGAISNCTFIDNDFNDYYLFSMVSDCYFINNIAWDNGNKLIQYNAWFSDLVIENNLIEGGEESIDMFGNNNSLFFGENNIDTNPLLSSDPGSYQLQENSPCIDAGIADFFWDDEQIFFIPDSLYVGSAPDMGACEYGMTDFETEEVVPIVYNLKQNYPNPFNPTTTISYSIPKDGKVSLEIYNIKGQKIKTLVQEKKEAGSYEVVWSGTDDDNHKTASGIYFYKIKAGKFERLKKMVLLK